MNRRNDDFIVDDEGYGYKDRGGEIWEVAETSAADAAKKKKRKLGVSLMNQTWQTLTDFWIAFCTLERWVDADRLYVPSKRNAPQQAQSRSSSQERS